MIEQLRARLAELVVLEGRFHELVEPEKAIADAVKQIVITLSQAYATLHAEVENIERQLALIAKQPLAGDGVRQPPLFMLHDGNVTVIDEGSGSGATATIGPGAETYVGEAPVAHGAVPGFFIRRERTQQPEQAAVDPAGSVASAAAGSGGADSPAAAPHTPREAGAEGRVETGATPGTEVPPA